MNRNNTTKIKTPDGLTDTVPVATGIRQGDSLSPTLFNVVMNEIIEEVRTTDVGYKMGNKQIKVLCAYADDAKLLAESENDL